MKTSVIFGLALALLSCSQDARNAVPLKFNTDDLPQQWTLFRMTGGLLPSVSEGDEMDMQERYELLADNTFVKTRTSEDGSLTGSGSFAFFSENAERGIVFTFDQDSDIIGNCTGDLVEYLYLDAESQTLRANWWACDGPGLFYRRSE